MNQRLRMLFGTGLVAVTLLGGACGGGGKADKEGFCKLLNDASTSVDLSTPAGVDKGLKVFNDLVDKAPSAVKDDVERLRDAFKEVGDAKSAKEIAKAQDRIDTPKNKKALEKVAKYQKAECPKS